MEKQVLTRQELYDLVWSTPLTTLAKRFSVSYPRFREICVQMAIPIPGSAHWVKLKFKKPVEIIKLPDEHSGENEITLCIPEEGDSVDKDSMSPLAVLEQELIEQERAKFTVPKRLTNPHKLIIPLINAFEKDNSQVIPDQSYIINNFFHCFFHCI